MIKQLSTYDLNTFESQYLKVRAKEGRVYTNDFVRCLPNVPSKHPQFIEWKYRTATCLRFEKYLKSKNFTAVLDLGCGNGWFSNFIHLTNTDSSILGLDVNEVELEQAQKLFGNDSVRFEYGDIFKADFENKFDLITINAAFQYFPNPSLLLHRLESLLNKEGEIHILDSPFYANKKEQAAAKLRTLDYFKNAGVPKMVDFYHHHFVTALSNFEVLYRPSKNRIIKKIDKTWSPFGWYRYIKH